MRSSTLTRTASTPMTRQRRIHSPRHPGRPVRGEHRAGCPHGRRFGQRDEVGQLGCADARGGSCCPGERPSHR
ncbi:hypothetical protein ACFPRL_33350 [Pseudoclavibacter helvolus]